MSDETQAHPEDEEPPQTGEESPLFPDREEDKEEPTSTDEEAVTPDDPEVYRSP